MFDLSLRTAVPADGATVAALAIQVFLDTYATNGIRPDLALEAFTEYGEAAFARRLQEADRSIFLAERNGALLGFAEVRIAPLAAPADAVVGAELVRLYVQPVFQHQGVGRMLLRKTEETAIAAALDAVWLTAWEGNDRARRFYAALGYQDVGSTTYSFRDQTYVNRVFAKRVCGNAAHPDQAHS